MKRLFSIGNNATKGGQVGWVLIMIETMRSEWGRTLHQAVFVESMAAAIALWPALCARHGVDGGVDHVATRRQAAKAKMAAWLNENYEVIDTPAATRVAPLAATASAATDGR